jgi:5S rRNA maturation endonuclease (ribonuclease M5)
MTYTRKTDLNLVTDQVLGNPEQLLDSFDLEYKVVNEHKICLPCPIHGGDNETGVSILTSRKTWACWTHNCHEKYGRTIFGFVQGILSTRLNKEASFKDALKYITNLYKINPKFIKNQKLENNSDFNNVARYFNKHEEEINQVSIDELKLDVPSKYFIKRDFKKETLLHFGVGDLKNRAMIPIYSEANILVGYIGRSIKPHIIPKFLFSEGLNKTDYLYNYHNAIEHIKNKNTIILVEGQGDVWRFFESKVYNAIGAFGKDLSPKQIELLLKSGVTNLIVFFDDDEAGREAKFKIQRQLHKLFKIKFPSLPKKDIGDLKIEEVENIILPQIKGFY